MRTVSAVPAQAPAQPLIHTFEEATALVEGIITESRQCADVLNDAERFPRNAMGLVTDAVQASPEYQAARKAYDRAFARERAANAWYVKTFPVQIREYREAQRQAKLQASKLNG